VFDVDGFKSVLTLARPAIARPAAQAGLTGMPMPAPSMDLFKPLIALLAIVNPVGAVPFSLAFAHGLRREERLRSLRVSAFLAFSQVLGRASIDVMTRLMGLILAAMAVALLADGLVKLSPILASATLR